MYSSTVTQFEEPPQKDPLDEVSAEPIALPKESSVIQPLIWRNVIGIAALHLMAINAFITSSQDAQLWTWIFSE